MSICIRNREFWSYVPNFIAKKITLPPYGIILLGYFPYHTARVKTKDPVLIPRDFVRDFEKFLYRIHIQDNKAVYICQSIDKTNQSFAIMLKDCYCIISSWEDVVQYDGKELHEGKNKQDDSKAWPCSYCTEPDKSDYCVNMCPLKKEDYEKDRKKENPSPNKDGGDCIRQEDTESTKS